MFSARRRPGALGGLGTPKAPPTILFARRSCQRYSFAMADPTHAWLGEHSDLRLENGALVFPMPVECYDHLMDGESLPRGASYNGLTSAMEVDAVPNGRYHDPRATALYHLFQQLRLASGVRAYAGTTAPLEGSANDRRHPDAQLFVTPAKLDALQAASRPAPMPDVVVEVDTTPLPPARERERLAAYARMGVPEVWVWRRTGGTEAMPEGKATLFAASDGGYNEAKESAIVPTLGPSDIEALLHERDDLARDAQAERLAERLAAAFRRQWATAVEQR